MPIFAGRVRELGALRSTLDRPTPTVVRVIGPPGAGKTALVARACADFATVRCRVPPLPEPHQVEALARAVADSGDSGNSGASAPAGGGDPAPASWRSSFAALAARADVQGRPVVLVLDDAHRLGDARARVEGPLLEALDRTSGAGAPLHVILVGPGRGLPLADHERVGLELHVGPLPLRAALPFLPGRTPQDRIRAWSVFGGLPGRLILLDPDASGMTNLRRLVLEPGAVLAAAGVEMLERTVQTPSRYAAVLAALAHGEADWSTVHAGVQDLTTSGQVAPYVARLERLGVVEVRRSLDAPARSRRRRYRIRDPFDAFWFRFVLPNLHALDGPAAPDVLGRLVRTHLDDHVATVFGALCRDYMALDAMERLPGNARESGSLWGAGYDLPVAGTLASGAVFYGTTHWEGRPDRDALAALDRQVGETRYGFGRELRLRVLFARDGFDPALARAAARRHDVALVDAAALEGDGGAS